MWVAWGAGRTKVVPDANADLVWSGDQLLVAGLDTTPKWIDRAIAPVSVGVRLPPGQLTVLAGVPAKDLVDRRVTLAELVGAPRARRLEDRIRRASDPGAELDVLLARLVDAPDDAGVAAASAIRDQLAAGATASSVAAERGWSGRRLHRFCVQRFGVGPKLLQQVLRFHRAYRALGSGAAASEVAFQCGFSDVSHLHRAVRRFAASTPGTLQHALSLPDRLDAVLDESDTPIDAWGRAR